MCMFASWPQNKIKRNVWSYIWPVYFWKAEHFDDEAEAKDDAPPPHKHLMMCRALDLKLDSS